jgi:phospholipid/cholesterol/gamma-HCH transport system substrate-binding protein
MEKQNKLKPLLITLIAVLIIGGLYAIAGGISLSRGPAYIVRFDYIGSVNTGSPVRKSGIRVGSVRNMKIDPEDQSTVVVEIVLDKGHTVRKSDRFAVISRGLLGDQSIEIFPGSKDTEKAGEGFVFQGEPTMDFTTILLEGSTLLQSIKQLSESLNTLLESNSGSIDTALENIEDFSKQLKEIGSNTLTLSREISSIGKSSAEFIDSLNTGVSGSLGLLNETLHSVHNSAGQIEALTALLTADDTTLSRLQSPENAEKLERTLENILILSENLNRTSERIRSAMDAFIGPLDE